MSRTSVPMQRLLERLYQWAKHDSSYQIPDGFTINVLIGEVVSRGQMAWRGILWRWRFKQVHGMTFVGRHVRIRAPELLSLGRSVTVHDDVRIDALSKQGIILGDNVTIREGCIIECTGVLRFPGEGLSIGDNTGISQYCFIGVRGFVRVGRNVQFGPRVTIYAENHNFDDPSLLIREQGVRREGITIEDDCWLGTGCTILDGVTVGKGSVIAAGCVVTKSVPQFSIVAGVPGRIIHTRGEK